jgi:hypothetical protein
MSSAHETKSLGPGINELALLGLADPMGCSVEAEKSLINSYLDGLNSCSS